uniref:Uncharacterized protein n=1 Tax=Cannabis sativa TaxID=3483 RepID=A0A803PY20_CANSA
MTTHLDMDGGLTGCDQTAVKATNKVEWCRGGVDEVMTSRDDVAHGRAVTEHLDMHGPNVMRVDQNDRHRAQVLKPNICGRKNFPNNFSNQTIEVEDLNLEDSMSKMDLRDRLYAKREKVRCEKVRSREGDLKNNINDRIRGREILDDNTRRLKDQIFVLTKIMDQLVRKESGTVFDSDDEDLEPCIKRILEALLPARFCMP